MKKFKVKPNFIRLHYKQTIIFKTKKMTKSILKSVAGGILIGAAIFFMPRLIIGVIILMAIFRFMFWRRMGSAWHRTHRFAMADKIRTMTDEEYQKLKDEYGKGCCHNYNNHCEEVKK